MQARSNEGERSMGRTAGGEEEARRKRGGGDEGDHEYNQRFFTDESKSVTGEAQEGGRKVGTCANSRAPVGFNASRGASVGKAEGKKDASQEER
eukprot:758443-Hanusia_phi.AAC.9